MANVLIIGRRGKCYRASLKLGHQTFLWSDGELHESRKKNLKGWIEEAFSDNEPELSDRVKEQLKSFQLDWVVAATESSVNIAASCRELLGLKGTSLAVANLLHNKYEMKKKARVCDIPITDFHLVAEGDTADSLVAKLGLPLVLKPVAESGARGVVVLKDQESVEKHMVPGLLAEAFVDGSEVSVETIIHQGKIVFHNITKYLHQWKMSILPTDLPEELETSILKINDQVIEGFGVTSGITHSEFYLTKNGPLFGEMAVRPPGGFYMNLIDKAYGFDPWLAYVQIETGGELPRIQNKAKKYACVYAIHPGGGVVQSIEGIKEISSFPEIFEFKFNLELGQVVADHEATSNEVGHVLMSSNKAETLLERLDFIEKNLKIDMKA